jgi:hypothetical protein
MIMRRTESLLRRACSTDLEHDLKFQLGEVQNILDEVRHILGARDGEGSTYAAERVVQQRNRLFEALENACPSDQTLEAVKPFVVIT